MQRKCLVPALVLLGVLLAPDPAKAADCGSPDPDRAGTVTGTLTLDDDKSTTRRDFQRERSGEERLQLFFKVEGCELRAAPKVSAGPLKDVAEEIPREALGQPKVETRPTEVKITYTVGSDSFDPGTYGSLVEISDEQRLSTVSTPITISRSESSILVPGAIGVVAGFLGFLVFYWAKLLARQTLTVGWRVLSLAVAFACGAGALAAIFNWLDQDVWVWQENWRVVAAAAFTQSTAGVVVAMIGGVFTDDPNAGKAGELPTGQGRFADAEDAMFWRHVFDACPPAFIKVATVGEDDQLAGAAEHVAENEPFKVFQGRQRPGDQAEEERLVIKQDHHRGDQVAIATGGSVQIESSDTYGMSSRRQIITFKQKIQYGDTTYIAGWYLPVELPPDLPETNEIVVRELGHLPVFRVAPDPRPEEPTVRLRIGKSSLQAAKAVVTRHAGQDPAEGPDLGNGKPHNGRPS